MAQRKIAKLCRKLRSHADVLELEYAVDITSLISRSVLDKQLLLKEKYR